MDQGYSIQANGKTDTVQCASCDEIEQKTDQYALRQKLAMNCVESQAFIKKNKFKNSHNQIEQHQINMRSIFKNMHTINNQSVLPSHLTHHIN